MQVDIIGGARPNFVKIAAIVNAMQIKQKAGGDISFRIIHTGQHYDAMLSGNFFRDLNIPDPDINLQVGSGTQAEQTGNIMIGYEKVLADRKPDMCLVVGDVTSTMACAIAARKSGVPVAHVEAGIRSGDWAMPEEINRVVTDSITNWFYTTTELASNNLLDTGIEAHRVVLVGNTMIDTLLRFKSSFVKPACWDEFSLQKGDYIVVTLHRPSNVDGLDGLIQTLTTISETAKGHPIVFPIHPRTASVLQDKLPSLDNLRMIDPLPYLEFNHLVSHSKGVVTDSGGITEETTVLGIPTITLRDSTERPETVEIGTNVLAGSSPEALAPLMTQLLAGDWKTGSIPKLWDELTGQRIVEHLLSTHHSDS